MRKSLSFRNTGVLLWLPVLLALACGGRDDAGRSRSREAYDLFFEDTFRPMGVFSGGGGSFGSWSIDPYGLPVYDYSIDHHTDPRASYYTSRGDSRDHWHQLGNDVIVATAHNEGFLEFWDWGRGGKCVNRYRPETGDFSGGFRFLNVGGDVWNTLYDAEGFDEYSRAFGVGYFLKESERNGLLVRERTFAPYGDDPILLSETEIVNRTHQTVELSCYEYWDYNLYELLLAPIMTPPLGEAFEVRRWRFNENFEVTTSYDPAGDLLRVETVPKEGLCPPAEDEISIADYHPAMVFLAPLTGTPDAYFTDQEAFFGSGGVSRPLAVENMIGSILLPPSSPDIAKACLVFRKDLLLEPGESALVAYAFGLDVDGDVDSLLAAYRAAGGAGDFPATAASWVDERVDFTSDHDPWLRREALWHGYYLASGAFYEDYYASHIVNQGSAYAYKHGLNGAHRDFALFCLPMIYIRPDLAREILRYTMRSQDACSGEIPYAHQGYGFASGYLIHEASSDLDLFFLLAAAEYFGATRDFGFLDEEVPYYPLSTGVTGTVADHLAKALDHLEYWVGTGTHGLVRVGSGDWNDVLIAFSPRPLQTMVLGESNLNTAMASFVLPRLARLLVDEMPGFSERLFETAGRFADRLEGEWTGEWMRRGYLGGGSWLGEDQLFLDAQPWAALAGIWDEDQIEILFGNIRDRLVEPSPAGALCLDPPNPAPYLVQGSDTNGGTWAAVDSWLVWAWSSCDAGAAWNSLIKSTLYCHAEVYPDIWYGVWSGPDSYNAFYADRPGETFNWSVTPMTDFPVMNMNRHSGPILDLIKMAGIEPCGDRITIDPKLPFEAFSLRLPLIGVAYLEDRMRGYYEPQCDGLFRFRVRLPACLATEDAEFQLDHRREVPCFEDGCLLFEKSASAGERFTWEVSP